jgi:small subunit ribosomal protein S9
MSKIISSGKRKRAVARAILEEGSGKVWINAKDYKTLNFINKLKIEEPLRIAENILGKLNFNISVNMRGGGEKGQIEAARVAISKGIVAFTKSAELEKAFLDYDRNLLVADVRRKEAYKPGDSKARSRRQKSYR